MFIGHYAVALGAKKIAPRVSLGTLVAAATFLDLLWPMLLIAGLEKVSVVPGITAFTQLDFESYPYSHSLLAVVLWGLLFGAGYYAVAGRHTKSAVVIGVLVVSHWILDACSHRPDLPLDPWSDLRVGLGLWNDVPATLGVELALGAAGLWMYLRATRPHDRIGRWGLAGFVALMLVIYAGAGVGPPPPDITTLAASGLALWLFVALAAWFDAHRRGVGGAP